jgi:hypothetical protein
MAIDEICRYGSTPQDSVIYTLEVREFIRSDVTAWEVQ